MSLYVQWLNLIKEKSTSSWLTDGQQQALARILSHWQAAPFINLWGPEGCGKSFIARILVKEHGYSYTHDLQTAPRDAANVIVDDARYSRVLRPTAQLLRVGRVILLSRRPVSDPMPRAEIRLTDKDVRQFLHNLFVQCGISFTCTTPGGTDLGRIIRDEAVAKGGCDADQ